MYNALNWTIMNKRKGKKNKQQMDYYYYVSIFFMSQGLL